MQIKEMNDGPKIDWSLEGSTITLGRMLSLDLSRYEQDDRISILVVADRRGCLYTTILPEGRYVAEIILPPRAYLPLQKAVYEADKPVVSNPPAPFDPDRYELRLWAVEAEG